MASKNQLLTESERNALGQIAGDADVQAQRASALLALDEGKSQAETAVLTNLTVGQVKYIRSKFGKVGLAVFPGVEASSVAEAVERADVDEGGEDGRLQDLVSELDGLLSELKTTLPESNQSPYSPLQLLTMIRENLMQLTPDVQSGILESFQDMTVEDLKDLETWKGMAYMLNYSARFQANQVKDKMNEQLPKPLKPDTLIGIMKQSIDRLTPDLAKDLYNNLQGTSKEDWMDPDTWKGMWYMINYSLQFQAEQLKQRVKGDSPEE
ncbi:MAG: helix-turn-helix domain-containing protein [Chloroflexi bacterium]|nr:MAG: helix-turn-helix domain-containing protein [Chloroflexota bacterium]